MVKVNLNVGRKLASLSTKWAKVSTWDTFNSLEDPMNQRIGSELPANLSKKSKMKEYNPGVLTYANFPNDRKYCKVKYFRKRIYLVLPG